MAMFGCPGVAGQPDVRDQIAALGRSELSYAMAVRNSSGLRGVVNRGFGLF